MTDGPEIQYSYFMFEEHTISKGGFLPDFEKGAHACWYYCICAHQNIESAANGAIYEGELDIGPALNNIARSVAMQYGFDDPGQFMVFMPQVLKEAERMNMGWDPRVLTPENERFKHVI